MQIALVLAALALGPPFGFPASADSTAGDLVRAMHDRYAGRWPSSVTFVQESTFYEGDSTRVETWYEAIGAPSLLRIDFAPIEEGNGVIFRNDSLYQFKGDSLVHSGPQVHPLMVLSRDVYFLPVEEVLEKLQGLGFDISKVRDDTWQGRPVVVVGAEAGDLKSPQFWVDKERLTFVRMIEPLEQAPSKIQEVQFNGYQRLGGGWIETEVLVFVDGRKVFSETYSDIREAQLEDGLFDPARWGRPEWVEG